MSSSIDIWGLSVLIEFVAVLLLAGYAGYWALSLRRALFVRTYRNQALAIVMAVVATVFIDFVNLAPGSPAPGSQVGIVTLEQFLIGGPLFLGLVFLGLFYVVDTTARAGRLSDPLLRDTLHWSQVRKVLWMFSVACVVLTFPISALLNTNVFLIIFTFFLPLVSGALMFPILARRSGDPTLRRHLGWLGAFFVFFFLSAFFFNGTLVLSGAFLVVAGFSLLRSGRSLAPLNRISPE